ncbi:hypothetical protein LDENG_00082600 [Lucifuga dentata]|nr:hypothetical protein LDENG_00082600 [Lucifuga dentata]
MGLYALLLLLGSLQRAFTQLPEWIGEVEGSVNCGKPGVDYNGGVHGKDWWVGSVVRYTCRSGFMLVGNDTRYCQPNGLWTPKPACLRMCPQSTIEVNEGELSGTCSSTCTYKSYLGPPKQGCAHIDNCKNKESGWKRFFSKCVPCICDCSIPCASVGLKGGEKLKTVQ